MLAYHKYIYIGIFRWHIIHNATQRIVDDGKKAPKPVVTDLMKTPANK
jgi:hypothetical protein